MMSLEFIERKANGTGVGRTYLDSNKIIVGNHAGNTSMVFIGLQLEPKKPFQLSKKKGRKLSSGIELYADLFMERNQCLHSSCRFTQGRQTF